MKKRTLDKTWVNNPTVELVVAGLKCNIYTDFLLKELKREKTSGHQNELWEGIMRVNYKDISIATFF